MIDKAIIPLPICQITFAFVDIFLNPRTGTGPIFGPLSKGASRNWAGKH